MAEAKEAKKVTVRVNQRIPLPYKARLAPEPGKPKEIHTFNPDCQVHPVIADILVKSQPDVYEIPEGKADLTKYARREEAVRENALELVQTLPESQRYELYAIIEQAVGAMKEGKSPASAAAAASEITGPVIHPVLVPSVEALDGISLAKLDKMNLAQLGNLYELLPGKVQPELPETPKKEEVVKALAVTLQLQ